MTPQFQYLVDWDGDTVFTGSLDDISSDVMDAEWFLGMRKAYQDCADESTLRLRVLNTGGKYNPENSAGTLYGKLKPRRRAMVRVTGYDDAPILQNLVSYWRMEETSAGNTRYDSVGSNHLSDVNTVGYATGKKGNCASFTRADNDRLSIADNASLSPGDTSFSFACWVKLDNKTNTQRILGKFNTTGNQREYLLQYNSTQDRFQWLVSSDGTTNSTATANNFGSPSTNTWEVISSSKVYCAILIVTHYFGISGDALIE
jgi:hypothetical protein